MVSLRKERGAAAVEFALVLPILLLLILGIFEFGRLFNIQIQLSNAAREAARVMAIRDNVGEAQSAAVATAPALNPAIDPGQVLLSVGTCEDLDEGTPVHANITYTVDLIIPGFWEWATGDTFELQAEGQMVCGG
ncbi:pilus assembly protein [Agromyces sp. Q22]|uniref:Pilus assembly protein n=1 Tax=Agromyces kandeliae TaxID=2666141 RepID=A0A6L5R0A3_9MICO|nr:pilus assembly protein [Agromyces kandeliae]